MPKIFISYRRADSEIITGRIYDHLTQAFGKDNIFKDVDNIPPGKDFRGVLREATATCDMMLVIIGSDWLTVTDSNSQRRLDDPNDFVRLEVETGLQRDSTTVIPILVKGAKPPTTAELPESLQQLAYNNAFTIHNDPHFSTDVQRLINSMQPEADTSEMEIPKPKSIDWKWVIGVVLIPIIVALITISPSFLGGNNDGAGSTEEAQVVTEETVEASVTVSPIDTELPTETETNTISPTHTPLPTETIINTVEPTLADTAISAATTEAAFPCEVIVDPDASSDTLNVVRQSPNFTSSVIGSIERGQMVTVIDASFGTIVFYRIQSNGRTLGWVTEDYLVLDDC